ncbi:hypothetical protein CHS0354_000528 [Potamilus streckersoni]|uniref:Uncharacterized protein n=1 Tax=Potamilus streckersoni TaxID=2493646 RepID=A0AAE0T6Q1_9BIVA|nr:hypothetical protein CHS0354_000528 [Potamilus streckersoni]
MTLLLIMSFSIISGISNDLYTQTAGTAGAFVRMGFSSTGIGLGNAGVAVTNDHEANPFYNPSLLGFRKKYLIGAAYTYLPYDRLLNFGYAYLPVNEGAGIGVSFINAGVTNIDFRNTSGENTGYGFSTENALILSFGHKLNFGVNFFNKLSQNKILLFALLIHFIYPFSSLAQNLPTNTILETSIHNNSFWILTNKGLFKTNDYKNFQAVYTESLTYISMSTKKNMIWLSTQTKMIASFDQGTTWKNINFPYDKIVDTIGYYGSLIPQRMLPLYESKQGSQFYITSIALDPNSNDVWIAANQGGLRRSKDFGQTWQRIFLPPKHTHTLAPSTSIQGLQLGHVETIRGKRYGDSVYLVTHAIFASNGALWVGTKSCAIVSFNPSDPLPTWKRFDKEFGKLPSQVILDIKEQTFPNSTPIIWLSTSRGFENGTDAISFSTNYGETWKTPISNITLSNLAFHYENIFATTNSDVFIANDTCKNWKFIYPPFVDKENKNKILTNLVSLNHLSTQKFDTHFRIWIATNEGLAYTNNVMETFSIIRAEIPVDENKLTYAYPNPFTPNQHQFVRIRFKALANKPVTIKILDFAMDVVKTISSNEIKTQNQEYEELWDGTTSNGNFVANGVYFYSILFQGEKPIFGKILVSK